MAKRTASTKELVQDAILYPVDWLEERSGGTGGAR